MEETTDDDDEVLVVTAAKIGEMVECVGGREYAHCLLKPLELLALVEEVSVRKATLLAVETVANAMSDADIRATLYALCPKIGHQGVVYCENHCNRLISLCLQALGRRQS